MKSLFQTLGRNPDPHHDRSLARMALVQAAVFGISFHGLVAAEGPISAVQEALKQQQFFFGESSGVLDEPTRAALRRFQIRRGLPVTGEIDTATTKALQNSPEAGPPTLRALPPEAKGPRLPEAIVEKDREFLQNLQKAETDREPMPPPVQISGLSAPPPPTVPGSPPSQAPARVQPPPREVTAPLTSAPVKPVQPSRNAEDLNPDVAKNRPVEKSGAVTTRKIELTPFAQSSDSPARRQREAEPIANAPSRRVELRNSPATIVESDADVDPLGPRGTRIIRSTTTTTGPDGRTYIYTKKTTTYPGIPVLTVRRAEPLESRRRDDGFLHRLFNGD